MQVVSEHKQQISCRMEGKNYQNKFALDKPSYLQEQETPCTWYLKSFLAPLYSKVRFFWRDSRYKRLTIFAESSILDIWQVFEYSSRPAWFLSEAFNSFMTKVFII